MIILALVFYCVLTKDLRVPHKKAITRCIVLAVVAVFVQFIVKRLTIEGLQNDTNCSDFTDASQCDASNCVWNASSGNCTTK